MSDKHEITKQVCDIVIHPEFVEGEVGIEHYKKMSLKDIPSYTNGALQLGNCITSLLSQGGGNGLYHVTMNTAGTLGKLKDGSGYFGAIMGSTGQIAGQASLTPVPFDPTMLLITTTLMSIESKLNEIQETQQEILDFLMQKERLTLRANLNFLSDILGNYKYNIDNHIYKNNNHIKVLDIKQTSEAGIVFYRDRIIKKTNKKSIFLLDTDLKKKIKEIMNEFKDYQLALYLYSFSSFLEVILLENYESKYLDSICVKIEKYNYEYRKLYTDCYNQLDKHINSSIGTNMIKGFAGVNKVIGNAIAKTPVISNGTVDEKLIELGDKYKQESSIRENKLLKEFIQIQAINVRYFTDIIDNINVTYNNKLELYFDKESIYIR